MHNDLSIFVSYLLSCLMDLGTTVNEPFFFPIEFLNELWILQTCYMSLAYLLQWNNVLFPSVNCWLFLRAKTMPYSCLYSSTETFNSINIYLTSTMYQLLNKEWEVSNNKLNGMPALKEFTKCEDRQILKITSLRR